MLLVGSRLASVLISLISIRAVTTMLTPEQFGELALLGVVQAFFGLFLINPAGMHLNVHTHAWWDDGTLMARLKPYRRYILVVSIFAGLVVLGMGKQHSIQQLLWTSIAMFAMVVAGTWNATIIGILNMLGFRSASVIWAIVTVAIGLISSILLFMWCPSATAWFSGQAIGMGLGALGANYAIRQRASDNRFAINKLPFLDRRTVFTYCLPVALATGLMWLQISGYRFLVEAYWGLSQLGFLVIGLQMAGQISALIESLVMQFLYPLFYRRISENEGDSEVQLAFSDLLNSLVPMYFVMTGLIILSAPYLLKILVAPNFQNAVTSVMLGAGIELCRVLSNLLSNVAHVKRSTKSLALPYAVGAIVTLFLIFFAGVMKMGITWVGAGLLVGQSAMLISMSLGMYRQVNFSLDILRWLAGVAVLLVMSLLGVWLPRFSGTGASVLMLMFVGVVSCLAVLALLWKNPAAVRLLIVQLRKN